MTAMTGTWINTASGRRFDIMSPRAEDVDIRDIAQALSNQCRFNGHCSRFYSVAEHCLHVSEVLEGTGAELWGLMHDAAEAYVGDVVYPLKMTKDMAQFLRIEERVHQAVAERYGLPWPMPEVVHVADRFVLCSEARVLLNAHPHDWPVLNTQDDMRTTLYEKGAMTHIAAAHVSDDDRDVLFDIDYTPTTVRDQFLARWRKLLG